MNGGAGESKCTNESGFNYDNYTSIAQSVGRMHFEYTSQSNSDKKYSNIKNWRGDHSPGFFEFNIF